MKLFFLFVAAAEEFSLIFLLGAWYDSNLTRSLVFFFSLHESHASFSWDVILVPILGLFLFSFFSFLLLDTTRTMFQVVTLETIL